jgi:hypothetical protein
MRNRIQKRKTNSAEIVHWILFVCFAMGVLGIVIQLIRFGAIVESGDIGPSGF